MTPAEELIEIKQELSVARAELTFLFNLNFFCLCFSIALLLALIFILIEAWNRDELWWVTA